MKQSSLLKTNFRKFFSDNRFCILSFFVPFAIMFVIYAAFGVHPFGTKQTMVTDYWHQYFPFLVELQDKLQSGGSLLYSWRTGLGSNFLSIIAYYCASPLNLLTALFNASILREVITVITMIKIGLAGLFMAIFLKKAFKQNDGYELLLFSVGYALSGFMIAYSWNIMWLDSAALFPLVALGIRQIFFEKKYKLYVITLALSVICNYYIGYMICIFTALYFIFLVASNKRTLKEYFSAFLRIALFSVIALAITAFITLPAYNALQLANKSTSHPAGFFEFKSNFIDILAKLFAFEEPIAKDGNVPNIYCGMLPLLCGSVFLVSKKANGREKISYVILVALMILSCANSWLNYAWHGFHVPNMVPFRFAFLISFILIELGFRGFISIKDDGMSKAGVASVFFIASVFSVFAFIYNDTTATLCALAVISVYLIILSIIHTKKRLTDKNKNAIAFVLSFVVIGEIAASAAVSMVAVRVSDYTSYPYCYDTVKPLIDKIEDTEDSPFYRVELTKTYTLNDPVLYGYNGVSQFSSTAVVAVTKFLKSMGLSAGESANRYYYAQTSEFINSILGVKYLIDRTATLPDNVNFEEFDSVSYSTAYKNLYALPLGYAVNNSIYDYKGTASVPFDAQNELFTSMTGIDSELFTRLDPDGENFDNLSVNEYGRGMYSYGPGKDTSQSGSLIYTYVVPDDGLLYAYVSTGDSTDSKYYVTGSNGKSTESFNIESGRPSLLCIGNFSAGEIVTVKVSIKQKQGSIYMHLAQLNEDTFIDGYNTLANETLQITSFEDTSISGTIDLNSDGVLFTSIPYEEGWTAQVDGVKVDIKKACSTFVSIPLSSGEHNVTLTYSPKGFKPGAIVSASAVVAFAAIWIIDSIKKKEKRISENG